MGRVKWGIRKRTNRQRKRLEKNCPGGVKSVKSERKQRGFKNDNEKRLKRGKKKKT